MTNIQKIKLSQIFSATPFAIAITVLYLQMRGLDLDKIFLIVGIHAFFIVILEFPTGVIGDRFSHRLSLLLGYTISAISFILLTLPGGFWYYALASSSSALGAALTSGSNTAYLHSNSPNFQKDFINVRTHSIILAVIATTLGPIFFTYAYWLPFIASSFFFFCSALMIFLTTKPKKKSHESANIFQTAKNGFIHSIENKKLFYLIVLGSILGTIFYNFKWLYNPLLSEINIPIELWGFIMGAGLALVALGTKLTQKFSQIGNAVLTILFVIFFYLMSFTNASFIVLLGFFIAHFIRGIFETKLSLDINESIKTNERASILSLQNFLVRSLSIGLTASFALIAKHFNFQAIIICTSFLLLVSAIFPIIKLKKYKKTVT